MGGHLGDVMVEALSLLPPQLLPAGRSQTAQGAWIDMRGVQRAWVVVNVGAGGTGAVFRIVTASSTSSSVGDALRKLMSYGIGNTIRADAHLPPVPVAPWTLAEPLDPHELVLGAFLGLSWTLTAPAFVSAFVLRQKVYA